MHEWNNQELRRESLSRLHYHARISPESYGRRRRHPEP